MYHLVFLAYLLGKVPEVLLLALIEAADLDHRLGLAPAADVDHRGGGGGGGGALDRLEHDRDIGCLTVLSSAFADCLFNC